MSMDAVVAEATSKLTMCPANVVLQGARHAARRLCMVGRAWVVRLDPVSIVADQESYTVVPAQASQPNAELYRLTKVEKLCSETWVEVDRRKYVFIYPSTFSFLDGYIPTEGVTDGLRFTVALRPQAFGPISECIPDEVAARYYDGLVGGTLAYCMGIDSRPYSNPNGAAAGQGALNEAIGQALYEFNTDGGTSQLNVRG